MSRTDRMFEIIQLLREAPRPLTAAAMATRLEVTVRTVYRDIAALQAMRVPIDGEAGVGYILRPGFDLPPLMFTVEEIEAIRVGLSLLHRTGDVGLLAAAGRAAGKINAALPDHAVDDLNSSRLLVSGRTAVPAARIELDTLRRTIREEEKLRLAYVDAEGRHTERTVRPIAVFYYLDAVVLVAWCELRDDFRSFRVDRVADWALTGERFPGTGDALRAEWQRRQTPAA